jgi:Acetyltransferase (GNAT) domain
MTGLATRRIDPKEVTASELEAIDGIIQRAYRMPSRMARINRFLSVQGGSWAVTEADGALVSVGASIAYPDGGFGWIGLVGTDPAMSGLGGGRAVTQFLVDGLNAQGCRSALDASVAGAPLYRAMNFTDHGRVTKLFAPDRSWASSASEASLFTPLNEHRFEPDFERATPREPTDTQGETTFNGRAAPVTVETPKMETFFLDRQNRMGRMNQFTVELFDVSLLKQLLVYDAEIFGANRLELLRYIVVHAPNRCFVARATESERILGYVISQADCIGPFCANDASVVGALLSSALSCSWSRAPEMIVPNNSAHLEMFLATGWTIDRTLFHQRLELRELPGDRTRLVAQVSFGEG